MSVKHCCNKNSLISSTSETVKGCTYLLEDVMFQFTFEALILHKFKIQILYVKKHFFVSCLSRFKTNIPSVSNS